MQVTDSKNIAHLQLLAPKIHKDFRGSFFEAYNKEKFNFLNEQNITLEFVEDNFSTSHKNVLKGLHGDTKTWKFIQCVYGSLFVAVADLRKESPTYLQIQTFELNDETRQQLLIPAGCVNGHLCLSENAILAYKQSEYYSGAENQISALWNDPTLAIPWPIDNPILSDRDKNALALVL
jgi:dTDP-4-dehydrorhamnose 3,5-epimerase